MKNNSLALLAVAVVMLSLGGGVYAQEVTPSPKPTGKFGEAVKKLREQNQEERNTLTEENKKAREALRERNKTESEDLREENKNEIEDFNEEKKNILEGTSPEEKLTLIPTIKAERKALQEQNKAAVQALRKTQWDAKKSLTENIQTNVDTFRLTVRSRWESLWSSFFGKK